MFKITVAQRKEMLSYMWNRPYGEVAQLITMLAGLKLETNTEVKNKKEN
jgi:hypothetical protein|tara:strand:+ start:249 stop:395 length:147 start_codon:yes stop_codon:yes gene_type:complete